MNGDEEVITDQSLVSQLRKQAKVVYRKAMIFGVVLTGLSLFIPVW